MSWLEAIAANSWKKARAAVIRLHRSFAGADEYSLRFGGVGTLLGDDGLARLRTSHVLVVGLGGVGSWAVEALARSGVGALTLVDADEASHLGRAPLGRAPLGRR